MFVWQKEVTCSVIYFKMLRLTCYCFFFFFFFFVTTTLLNFTRLFLKAHEENCKQTVLEKKKADKEAEMEKAKGINFIRKSGKDEEEES